MYNFKTFVLYLFIIGAFIFTPSFLQDLKAENNNAKISNGKEIAGFSVRFGHGRGQRGFGRYGYGNRFGRHGFRGGYGGYSGYNRYYSPRYRYYYNDPYFYYNRRPGVQFYWYNR